MGSYGAAAMTALETPSESHRIHLVPVLVLVLVLGFQRIPMIYNGSEDFQGLT